MLLLSPPTLTLWKLTFPSCRHCSVAKSCPSLCDPMDCSPPGSSVREISQARILEPVAICPSRDLPDPGIKPTSPSLAGGFFTAEPPGKPLPSLHLSPENWRCTVCFTENPLDSVFSYLASLRFFVWLLTNTIMLYINQPRNLGKCFSQVLIMHLDASSVGGSALGLASPRLSVGTGMYLSPPGATLEGQQLPRWRPGWWHKPHYAAHLEPLSVLHLQVFHWLEQVLWQPRGRQRWTGCAGERQVRVGL